MNVGAKRGKAYGNRLSAVWELALTVRRRQTFHAAGGLHGVSVHEYRAGFRFPRPRPGVLTARQTEEFAGAYPDYVVYSGDLPIGWHAATDGHWRVLAAETATDSPLARKHRMLLSALVSLGAVVGQTEEPDAPGDLRERESAGG